MFLTIIILTVIVSSVCLAIPVSAVSMRDTVIDLTLNTKSLAVSGDEMLYDPSTEDIHAETEGWSWNAAEKTLTLKGCLISVSNQPAVILPDNATVVVEKNSIFQSSTGISGLHPSGGSGYAGIYGGNFTITGSSLLTVSATGAAIYSTGSLTVSNASLNAVGNGTAGTGISAQNIAISNANVTADGAHCGIFSESTITIERSSVSAKNSAAGSSGMGINAGSSINIINANVAADALRYGIVSGGSIRVVSSEVTASGNQVAFMSLGGASTLQGSYIAAPVDGQMVTGTLNTGGIGSMIMDSTGSTVATSVRLSVGTAQSSKLKFKETTLPNAYAGSPYSAQLSVEGPGKNIRYMIFEIVPVGDNTIMATVDMNEVYAKGIAFAQSPDAAGRSIQIPSGLILDTVSGVISGTPTKAGKYAFYAIAINEYGVEGSAAFDVILLDVKEPKSTTLHFMNEADLPEAVMGEEYYLRFVTDSTSSVTYEIQSVTGYQKALPEGMYLTSAGVLTGAPKEAGNWVFRIKAKDTNNAEGSETFLLIVSESCTFETESLPGASAERYYSAQIAMRGDRRYTFSIDSGSLPAGLTIKDRTENNVTYAEISGTPSKTGTYTFTVKAYSAGSPDITGYQKYTIIVSEPLAEPSRYEISFSYPEYTEGEFSSGARLSLTTLQVNDYGYQSACFYIRLTEKPVGAVATMLYSDGDFTDDDNIFSSGVFPSADGYRIRADEKMSFPFKMKFSKAGTYKMTVTFYDLTQKKTITEKEYTVIVRGKNISVQSVKLSQPSINLFVGGSDVLTAEISPATATNKKITWSSSNPSVVSVTSSGKITAKKEGTATITVTTEDGRKTASCRITVKNSVSDTTKAPETSKKPDVTQKPETTTKTPETTKPPVITETPGTDPLTSSSEPDVSDTVTMPDDSGSESDRDSEAPSEDPSLTEERPEPGTEPIGGDEQGGFSRTIIWIAIIAALTLLSIVSIVTCFIVISKNNRR